MPSAFITFRYLTYAAFVICNAIIASVAVWGLSLAKVIMVSVPVAPYLIFVGCLGLVVNFLVIFLELLYRHAITSKVWFECFWVGLFLFFELIGASLATSDSLTVCSADGASAIKATCSTVVSTLQAFAWLCTATLFFYFSVLIICAGLRHHRNGPMVWRSHIKNFTIQTGFPSPSPTSTVEPFMSRPSLSVVAPKPRRPVGSNLVQYHTGLSQYEIEHYEPPSPPPPLPTLHQVPEQSATAYYPVYLQSSLVTQPAAVHPYSNIRSIPIAPPLGAWPRADILSSPVHPKHLARETQLTSPTSEAQFPSRSRPSGPRHRSGSGNGFRPPPLDLSKISSFGEYGS